MKFELKTENDNYSKTFWNVLKIFFSFSLIIVFCDVALKLGIISRHFQIEYSCKLLSVDKSKHNFKQLFKLSNLKSKQKIWEFCKHVVK